MAIQYKLAVHGGAGTLAPEAMTPELETTLHAGLRAALLAGQTVLARGGSALDAVEAAVATLEDDAQFNAGAGSVFNAAGLQEMDAAIMDGRSRSAGAVAGICGPRNPIRAARAVMDRSGHALLAGEGAHEFLRGHGVPFEEPEYFQTERRWLALQGKLSRQRFGRLAPLDDADRHGTVGAVAVDAGGGTAAATSTGGTTGKLPGRIGDTPLIGSGTLACGHCAVSATGVGEHSTRAETARDLCARMRSGHEPIADAAAAVIGAVGRSGGSGGLIAVDGQGNVAMPFSSRGMYRGTIGPDGIPWTALHREDLRRTDRTSQRL